MAVDITIIGQGKMGKLLAHYFESHHITVQLIGRDKDTINGQFVILALPYEEMPNVLKLYQSDFIGKIIIDMSNPMDYATKTSVLENGQSATLNLMLQYPQLTFIKAFNTNFSSSKVSPMSSPIVMFSGDDIESKLDFSQLLIKAMFIPIDVGTLQKSIDLEAFSRIQLQLLEQGQRNTLSHFAL